MPPSSSEDSSALRKFLDHEATGGMLLALSAIVAIVLVNFGLADEYKLLLEQRVNFGVGTLTLDKSLHHFINDGLMAVFFFVIGLEIKREVVEGNLAERSQILLPTIAAFGGIVAPALIYACFNYGNALTLAGWAIPSATDIAFALGALALAGSRIPLSLKVFLLTIATMDDIAAIIIIALFYSSGLSPAAIGLALMALAVLLAFNRMGMEWIGPYILAGLLLWLFVLKSGVHATLAGVVLGLFIPLRRRDGSSPLHKLEDAIHPYVKYLVLPLFAFANAGIPLGGLSLANLTQPVPLGIVMGLTIGKPAGILLATVAVVATGFAKLPEGANWRQVIGVACLAGIGFTMSLFIGSLAFTDAGLETQVRVGVIAGSVISMIVGLAVLLLRPQSRHSG